MKCEICGRECKNYKSLSVHVVKTHKLSREEYYNKFLKINDLEGFCKVCDKKTCFLDLKKGYCNFCSRTCMQNSKEIKEKKAKTSLRHYGVKNPFQSEEIKNKIKSINLRRYGFEHSFQNPDFEEKRKKTCLEKYGVEHPSQSEEVQQKRIKTCLEKYGVEYNSQSEEIKQKKVRTCLEHYGVEHPLQAEEVKARMKDTCLEKYGVEYYVQSEKHKNEMKDGGATRALQFRAPSEPQYRLYQMVLGFYPQAVLEYPIRICEGHWHSVDIAIPDLKIAIEYDEPYFHQDVQKDLIRKLNIQCRDWEYISYKELPTMERLKNLMIQYR